MILRVLIVDDDEGMRLILKKAIAKADGFKIVGEFENGKLALDKYEELMPQIIFMDVEMPEMDGLECAKKIMESYPKTFIIMATAHEEYMPDAFELYAFDYLTKPFKMDRIFKTLERIKSMINLQEDSIPIRVKNQNKGFDKLIVKNKEGINFIDVQDIIMIERENRSTVVVTVNEKLSTSESLSELEERLDRTVFFRSHKSYIINLTKINKIYPYGRWTYIIKLKDTEIDALITHEKYEELKKIFEG